MQALTDYIGGGAFAGSALLGRCEPENIEHDWCVVIDQEMTDITPLNTV